MNFFSGLVLAEFDLKVENIFSKGENTFFIIKENWDYQLALKFQEEMVSRVYTDKEKKVFIICNHPHCLTLGRGLQRRTKIDNDLIDFDEDGDFNESLTLGYEYMYNGQTYSYEDTYSFTGTWASPTDNDLDLTFNPNSSGAIDMEASPLNSLIENYGEDKFMENYEIIELTSNSMRLETTINNTIVRLSATKQ